MSNSVFELIYVHDPMCSWCWGFDKTRQQLFDRLAGQLQIRRLLGGLAADSAEPMPQDMQHYLQNTWQKIEQRIPGTRFNFDFWTKCKPRRSTWPACRAVIAARAQGAEFDSAMTRSIQEAYYLQAQNPSNDEVLIDLAKKLGLNAGQFESSFYAEQTQQQLEAEIMESRSLGAGGFPSLIFLRGEERWKIPVDYTDSQPMYELLMDLLQQQ